MNGHVSINRVGPLAGTPVTGQIAVTTAGTSVLGPDLPLANGVFLRALAGNTGVVYFTDVGNNDLAAGDDISGTGYELSAGDTIPVMVGNLNELLFDAAVSGEGFAWVKG